MVKAWHQYCTTEGFWCPHTEWHYVDKLFSSPEEAAQWVADRLSVCGGEGGVD